MALIPIALEQFPALNASLNGTTALLLVTGYILVRRRALTAHRVVMISAFCCSMLFLACYLYYHYHAGSRRFPGSGTWRTVYLSVLLTHTVLATAVVPLAITTIWLGLKSRFAAHRRIARWTLPVWLYVSVTGVVVYWMLYRISW